MKRCILLLMIVLISGCSGKEYTTWETCHSDCIKSGYEDGNCLVASAARPLVYKDVGSIGDCRIDSGPKADVCKDNACNCYCYNLIK